MTEPRGTAFWMSLCLLLLSGQLAAQNLIPNPSFELYGRCPKGLGEIAKTEAWSSPTTATPDYFNGCVKKVGHAGAGVPNNFFGIQPAFSGDAYAGIYHGEKEVEYLQVALTQPLEAEMRYCLRFRASPASWKVEGLDALQVWFRDAPLSTKSWEKLDAGGESMAFQYLVVERETDWALMSLSFVARGGETHLVLGYFGDLDHKGYTFVDDFELYPYESVEGCANNYFTGDSEQDLHNLVPNPGFELMWDCPDAREHLHRAKGWIVAEETPDFYHRCGQGTARVPQNELGEQEPHSGDGYGGFWAYLPMRGDYREFITVRLKEPLKPRQVYCLSMWVSLADISGVAVSDLQMMASKTVERIPSRVNIKDPRIVFLSGEMEVLKDAENWVQISAAFIANGGEKLLTIGNFRENDDPKIVPFDSVNKTKKAWGNNGYYYVDDVAVYTFDDPLSPCPDDLEVQAMAEVAPIEVELPTAPPPPPAPTEWKAGDTLVLEHFLFAFDSRELEVEARPILDTLAAYLDRHPDLQLEISGHTDDQGSEAYNLKLSKGRAEAVQAYLAGLGIGEGRMVAEGKGEAEPIVPNDSDAHRAKNRRVAIRFL